MKYTELWVLLPPPPKIKIFSLMHQEEGERILNCEKLSE